MKSFYYTILIVLRVENELAVNILNFYKMKLISLIFYLFYINESYAQLNMELNSSQLIPEQDERSIESTGGISCKKNIFWSVAGNGDIIKWNLNSTLITNGSVVLNSPVISIAYCNSLNGGSIPSTFYGTSGGAIEYYDGTNWITIPVPYSLYNGAGFGQYVYFFGIVGTYLDQIVRYDGNVFTVIRQLQNEFFTVADLAVDANGVIWALKGAQQTFADSLIAMDMNGNTLYTAPLSLDTYHTYGCFMNNGTLYLGLGSANPVYPSSILPISISTTGATLLPAISFPNSDFYDLASCTPGVPIFLTEISGNEINQHYNFYPNPTDGIIYFKSLSKSDINIFNTEGKLLRHFSVENSPEFQIDLSDLAGGIYHIQLQSENHSQNYKVVKLN
jgi:hypothetical protein